MNDPLYFAFGLHAHQPVGNFDHVFEDHLRQVYEPFIRKAAEGGLLPLTLHVSGPLLDWMETHDSDYLDFLGKLVSDGKLELLLAGYYEPILPSLLREDRVEQVLWMQEALKKRFGTEARGLWLTERVWEPDLASDLVDAGVEYVLVDDRHFVAAGFPREELHQPFRTEFGGKSLGVFAIDETLRYYLPFRSPEDTRSYLRDLRNQGRRLAVAADDIEKFGGWPGTREWVYERGWLENFISMIKTMESEGEVRIVTFGQAVDDLPSGGLAYLPSSSYREMEEWTLPPAAFHRLEEVKETLRERGFPQGESPLVRGSHWRNFFVKYPEANRMHKKAMVLSRLSRERGDPGEARRLLGAAQCNDAYWHGVFGGLYLRHLRDTIWHNLARAEGELRSGERLLWEMRDMDLDGHEELWLHSSQFSAVIGLVRGGGIEEMTIFRRGVNLANTLTRRREAYHELPDPSNESPNEKESSGEVDPSTAPSIHDLEEELRFSQLPPEDSVTRALFQDRVLSAEVEISAFENGTLLPEFSWTQHPLRLISVTEGEGKAPSAAPGEDSPVSPWVEINLEDGRSDRGFQKRIRFWEGGEMEIRFEWDPSTFHHGSLFSTELSLGAETTLLEAPEATTWRFPISTFSKSEGGFDEMIQGESVVFLWPSAARSGRILLIP